MTVIDVELDGDLVHVTIARDDPDGVLADDTFTVTLAEAREIAQQIEAVAS